jgi:hypothetical protein
VLWPISELHPDELHITIYRYNLPVALGDHRLTLRCCASALLFFQWRIGFIRRRLRFGALGFAQRGVLVSLSLFLLAPSTCRPRSLGSISSVIWLKCHWVSRWLITHLSALYKHVAMPLKRHVCASNYDDRDNRDRMRKRRRGRGRALSGLTPEAVFVSANRFPRHHRHQAQNHCRARWALLLIVRTLFNNALTIAVWTGFHVCLPLDTFASLPAKNVPSLKFEARISI